MTGYGKRPYTLEVIARHIVADGGATLRYVGHGDFVHVTPEDERVWCVGTHALANRELADINNLPVRTLGVRIALSDLVRSQGSPGVKVGAEVSAWIDGNTLYVDRVTRIADLDQAKGYGWAWDQKAIFNLATGETVTL